jgi:hypothetical protein
MISNAARSYGVEQLMNQANVPGEEDLTIHIHDNSGGTHIFHAPVMGDTHVVHLEIPQPAAAAVTYKTIVRPTIELQHHNNPIGEGYAYPVIPVTPATVTQHPVNVDTHVHIADQHEPLYPEYHPHVY